MRTCALLLACAALAFAPAPFPRARRPADPNQALLKKIQGTWTTVSRTYGGRVMKGRGEMTVVFSGDRVKYLVNGEVRTVWVITLDTTKKPIIFDRAKVDGKSNIGKGMILRGLCSLEGDTLTVCYRTGGTERPGDLERSRPGVWHHVMKRQKP
jgi:uncharacterized protein (TIGR03067 family)